MSVLRQFNFLSQMRVDVPHFRSIESSIAADFDVLAGRVMTGSQAVVVRGFTLTNISSGAVATAIQLSGADGILANINASESGTFLWIPTNRALDTLNPTTNSKVNGSWTPNQVNYVSLDFVRSADSTTTDLVEFLDAGTLLETPEQVPLGKTLDYKIVIGTVPFSAQSTVIPIAKVTLDSSSRVTAAIDARPLFFRLGSGGDNPQSAYSYPWPQGRAESTVLGTTLFTGGDKAFQSQKDWMQAVMSRLWEVGGGEYWYSATADRNVNMVWTGTPFSGGENFEFVSSNVHWKGIRFLFDNSSAYFNDVQPQTTSSPGLTDLNDGDCLYVDLDRTQLRANQWLANTSYLVGDAVYNLDGSTGRVYVCTIAGTSAASGGPTGTGTAITDNTVTWKYVANGSTAIVAAKSSLILLGSGSPPGARQVMAWRVGGYVYTRGWRYAIGTVFQPATPTSMGMVKLNETNVAPSTPIVVGLNANNGIDIGYNGSTGIAITGTSYGILSAGGVSGGVGIYGQAGGNGTVASSIGFPAGIVGTGDGVHSTDCPGVVGIGGSYYAGPGGLEILRAGVVGSGANSGGTGTTNGFGVVGYGGGTSAGVMGRGSQSTTGPGGLFYGGSGGGSGAIFYGANSVGNGHGIESYPSGPGKYALYSPGNIGLDGDYQYSTTKTFTYYVSLYDVVSVSGATNNFASVTNTTTAQYVIRSQIRLPVGATITGLSLNLSNSDTSTWSTNYSIFFWTKSATAFTSTSVVNSSISLPNATTQNWFNASAFSYTVPANGYLTLTVNSTTGAAAGTQSFYGCYITYTMNTVAPPA